MKLKGPLRRVRQNVFSGGFYVRELRGQLIVCKWPRKRGRNIDAATKKRNIAFKQSQQAIKFMPARIQAFHQRITEGTPLMPRDLLTAGLYGRVINPATIQNPRRYSMAALRDISDTLDIVGANVGDLLVRGPDGWTKSTPTAPGQSPVSNGPDQAPSWQTLGAPGGGWTQVANDTLASDKGAWALWNITVPGNWQQLDIMWWLRSTGGGINPRIRYMSDASNNAETYCWSVKNSLDHENQRNLNTPSTYVMPVNPAPFLGPHMIKSRMFQNPYDDRIYIRGEAWAQPDVLTQFGGVYENPTGNPVTQIGVLTAASGTIKAGSHVIALANQPPT